MIVKAESEEIASIDSSTGREHYPAAFSIISRVAFLSDISALNKIT